MTNKRRRGKPFQASELAQFRNHEMTAELARQIWSYDPQTGKFTWNYSPRLGIGKGDPAGIICKVYGYQILCFCGRKFRGARIAYLMMTGTLPPEIIDHKNCDRADDRWENIRPATQGQNLCNTRIRKDNALGIKGVSPTPSGTFAAYICVKGRRKNLGSFKTAAEAKIAYDTAARDAKWHGEFARSG